MSCLFLNIKKTFDYVNKKQLFNIMKKVKISSKLLKWTKNFMKKRKIKLKFDDFQSNLFDVNCDFFQKFPIFPILWLIYVKHLH